MGFLRKLFGGQKKEPGEYVDTRGVYFYAQCDNCGTIVKLRADKEYDLERVGGGYEWHKTIVDSRCFRRMPAVVTLDGDFEVVEAQISGGQFVTEAAYLRSVAPAVEEDVDEPAADADSGEVGSG